MTNRIFGFGFSVLLLPLVLASASFPVLAQGEKPTRVLRQFQTNQTKLQEEFDRDVNNGKAQLWELDSRIEAFRKQAAGELTGYNIADWKGDELLALYSLYQQTELFAQMVEAGRAFLKTEPKTRITEPVRYGMIHALIELEHIEEAQQLMDELYKEMPETVFQVAGRMNLLRDLVAAWRERGRYDLVAKYALRGYGLRTKRNRFSDEEERLSDVMLRDRLTLAAEYVSAQERLGLKKEAAEFHKKVLETEFDEQTVLKSYYESQLAAARLMFNPAPELDVSYWLRSDPIRLANLRGKVVLLDFWAVWCSECPAAFPQWRELQNQFSDKGLTIIGVTKLYGRSDTEEGLTREQELKALLNFQAKRQLNYPIAIGKMDDVTNDERFVVASLPTVVLIDRRGNVRYFKRGIGEYRKLKKQIEKLINEK